MKVLVTGGAGFIGAPLVKALCDGGHEVVVLDNFSTGMMSDVPNDVHIHNASVLDDTLGYILSIEKPDVVYHLAADCKVREAESRAEANLMINLIASVRMIQACIENEVTKIVYAASGGTGYGEPIYVPIDENHPINSLSVYGISKHTVEHYLYQAKQIHGLDYTVLRYANVYGPRQAHGIIPKFVEKIEAGHPPTFFGDGSATRDYVYIDNVTEANLLVLDKGDGEIYNVGSGEETSVAQMYEHLGYILMPGQALPEPECIDENPFELKRNCLDWGKINRDLGWCPSVGLLTGLRHWYKWYKDSNYYRPKASLKPTHLRRGSRTRITDSAQNQAMVQEEE